MNKLKLYLLVWIVMCLLFNMGAGCQNMTYPDANGISNTDMAPVDPNIFIRPSSFQFLSNTSRPNVQYDWICKNNSIFPLKQTTNEFTTDYTFRGNQYTLDQFFQRNHVLGYLVLHDDQIMLEKYFNGAVPQTRFISNSMAKSITSVLIGIAIENGAIESIDDPATRYLPCLSDSGFKNVTIKQLLQMTSGVEWNENYLDPSNDINRFTKALSQGTPTLMELAAGCQSEVPPGTQCRYQSINTQVLGLLLEEATGTPVNKYCERELWEKIGAENDAFFYRGKQQPQIPTLACFCATVRDYGRFGLMMMNGGKLNEQQIISKDWVDVSTGIAGAAELPHPEGLNHEYADNLGYAYQWWLLDKGVYMAMGIYGQGIYIDPANHIVIVQVSDWPEPDSNELWDEMITVMETITDKVCSSGRFTQQIWDVNYPFYQKILKMPFNQELLSGELDEQVFKDYIVQDYLYLQNYKKAYAILLLKAPDESAMQFMLTSINIIDEEIDSIHKNYIDKYNVTGDKLSTTEPNPSTEFYNSYLIKTATIEPFEVGIMAMLPCQWIYYQLGVDLKQSSKVQNNKYQTWIDGYGDETWEKSETKTAVDFVEKYMRATTDENRLKMKKAYETSMKLEYMFWDGVYKKVKWIE